MFSKTNIFDAEWLEIVFVNRNKNYGAYELRKKGSKYTIQAIIFSVSAVATALGAPVLFDMMEPEGPREIALKDEPPLAKSLQPPMSRHRLWYNYGNKKQCKRHSPM